MDINGFLRFLRTRTTSVETLRAYRQDLDKYEAFLRSRNLRVTQVKPTTITDFIDHLNSKRSTPMAPASVARRLAVLKSFHDYIQDKSDGTIPNPVDRVKRPKVQNELPRAVDDQALARLIDGITDVRDRAIILLFIYSGLRLSELRQLNKDTIVSRRRRMPDGSIIYLGTGEVQGKGRKRRTFIVGEIALQALADYLREKRSRDPHPALFLSSRRQRISCRNIQDILDRWCSRLGIPHAHVHQLRHSFATRNVNAGMSAAVLQELMGHASLSTSQRYFRVKPERLSREYFAAMEYLRQTSEA